MGKIVSRLRQFRALVPEPQKEAQAAGGRSGALRRGSIVYMSHVAHILVRGFCAAMLILLPALLLPEISIEAAQAVTLLALLAAIVVGTEYAAAYPGLIEFRDAKPYNRARFVILLSIVLLVTLVQREVLLGAESRNWVVLAAFKLGTTFDFAFSPVRLMVMSLPQGLPLDHLALVAAAASLAYLLSIFGLATLIVLIMIGYWPHRHRSFNVWINLPNFDPTKGVDVVRRLERDAHVNILLGIILPFSLPVLLHISTLMVQPMTLQSPLAFVWGIALWAFIPVNLILRGVAMHRVAQLVRAQRRRMAEEEDAIPLPARSAYS